MNKKISVALSFALLILRWSVPCLADNLYAVSHSVIAGGSEYSLLSSHSTAIKFPADTGSMDQRGVAIEELLKSSQAPGLISALDDSALYCDSGGEFIQADRMMWKDPLSAHSLSFFSLATCSFFTVSNTSEPGEPLMPIKLVLLGIALFGLAGYGGRKKFRR